MPWNNDLQLYVRADREASGASCARSGSRAARCTMAVLAGSSTGSLAFNDR